MNNSWLVPVLVAVFCCSACDDGGEKVPGFEVPALTCAPENWPTAATVGLPGDAPALSPIVEDLHTEHDGQVFDGVLLTGRLYVDHPNVVIRNSLLVGDIYYAVYSTDGGTGLTIEDCDITGGVLIADGFTGRRNHLYAAEGGTRNDGWIFSASHVLLEDNLIDGLVGSTGAHLDGIQVMGGDDVVIRHNWIEAVSPPIDGGGVNAAVFFKPDFGRISNVVVDCNMLIEEEGYYPLRIQAVGQVVVRSNRWRAGHLGGSYHLEDTVPTVWEDNAYEDGTPVTWGGEI